MSQFGTAAGEGKARSKAAYVTCQSHYLEIRLSGLGESSHWSLSEAGGCASSKLRYRVCRETTSHTSGSPTGEQERDEAGFFWQVEFEARAAEDVFDHGLRSASPLQEGQELPGFLRVLKHTKEV